MRFRAPVPADAPAVLAVFAARDRADLGAVEHRLEDLREEWSGSDLDLRRNARVVESAEGRIVAYAAVRRPGTIAVVAPDAEGRGVGSRLLAWSEARDHGRGRDLHRQWVAANNASARALLTAAGYRRARGYWLMVRSLQDRPAAPDVPAGFALRAIDPAHDAPALHAVDDASFAAAPDYMPTSLEQFVEELFEAHDFDAALSRVVTDHERAVGFLLARRRRDEAVAFVDVLAVEPAFQGRGLGPTLLRSAFAAFAEAGLHEAQLSVSSENPHALRTYERAGMSVRHRFDIYEKAAKPPPSRWRSFRDVDAAEDPASLAGQLDAIASVRFVAAEKRRSLELLRLRPGDAVLDVGCGTGGELGELARLVGPRGRVIGLEPSVALIAAARERGMGGAKSMELVNGDARALPFADGEFAASRADRTLQHLDRPEAGLAEMARVTRAGGRVVVTESRWGLIAPSLDQALTDRVLGRVASETEPGAWLGHRLPAMFEQAGLIDVETASADYTTNGREELMRFTHVDAAVAEAARAGAIGAAEADHWLESLDELLARGEAFAMVLFLHVSGITPSALAGQ